MDKKRGFVKTFSSGMRMDFKKLDTLEDEVVFQETNRARLFSFICNNYCISLALPGLIKIKIMTRNKKLSIILMDKKQRITSKEDKILC